MKPHSPKTFKSTRLTDVAEEVAKENRNAMESHGLEFSLFLSSLSFREQEDTSKILEGICQSLAREISGTQVTLPKNKCLRISKKSGGGA